MATYSKEVSFSGKKGMKIVGCIFAVIGVIFAIVGYFLLNSSNGFISRSVEAELHVFHVEQRVSDGNTQYRPHFEARRDDGEVVKYVGNTWVSPKPHNAGDVVPGRVDWETGQMRSVGMMAFMGMLGKIFAAIGGGVCILGVGLVLFGRWRERQANVI